MLSLSLPVYLGKVVRWQRDSSITWPSRGKGVMSRVVVTDAPHRPRRDGSVVKEVTIICRSWESSPIPCRHYPLQIPYRNGSVTKESSFRYRSRVSGILVSRGHWPSSSTSRWLSGKKIPHHVSKSSPGIPTPRRYWFSPSTSPRRFHDKGILPTRRSRDRTPPSLNTCPVMINI